MIRSKLKCINENINACNIFAILYVTIRDNLFSIIPLNITSSTMGATKHTEINDNTVFRDPPANRL